MLTKFMKYIQELKIGAINGAIIGFLSAIGINLFAYAELWFRGLLNDKHVITAWAPTIKITFLGMFIVGIARCLTYLLFQNFKNSIISWHITGLLSIGLFYLSVLTLDISNSFFLQSDFQWEFAESLNFEMWIIVSFIVLVFNFFYALLIKQLWKRNKTPL